VGLAFDRSPVSQAHQEFLMDAELRCSKCAGTMMEGSVLQKLDGLMVPLSTWVEGQPEITLLGSTKTPADKTRTVAAFCVLLAGSWSSTHGSNGALATQGLGGAAKPAPHLTPVAARPAAFPMCRDRRTRGRTLRPQGT
jgi:hypothetical protein